MARRTAQPPVGHAQPPVGPAVGPAVGPPAPPGVPVRSAQIHEQGYERYNGPRLEQSNRFWIVATNVASIAWRSRWAVKIPIVLAFLSFIGAAVFVYLNRNLEVPVPPNRDLISVPVAIIVGMSGWLTFLGMIVGAALGCSTVADDLKVGAFQFYFSRSLRTIDYTTGKVLGVLAMVAAPMLAVPVLLALARLAFVDGAAELEKTWLIAPRAFAWGAVGATVFTLVPTGLGAAVANKRAAQAGYVAYYLIISTIAKVVARKTETPAVELLAIDATWLNVGRWIFELPMDPSAPEAWQSLAALLAFSALGFSGLWWRVRGAEVSSVGGGT